MRVFELTGHWQMVRESARFVALTSKARDSPLARRSPAKRHIAGYQTLAPKLTDPSADLRSWSHQDVENVRVDQAASSGHIADQRSCGAGARLNPRRIRFTAASVGSSAHDFSAGKTESCYSGFAAIASNAKSRLFPCPPFGWRTYKTPRPL
jgi:hypothetical protein